MKTFGIVRCKLTLPPTGKEPVGIDFVFVAGDATGLKRVFKVCRSGDRVVPLNGMRLSRLTQLAFERAGVSVVQHQSILAERELPNET